MPLGIGPKVDLGEVKLKGGVFEKTETTKKDFVKKVDDSLKDGVLTKAEYKSLKDSMVGGRGTLNDVLAKAGVASKGDLERIFAAKKDGSIAITPEQKDKLKEMLTGVKAETISAPVTTEVILGSEAIKELSESKENVLSLLPPTDIGSRYSLSSFMFNPELSVKFKEHLKKESSTETIAFLESAKKVVESPLSKESLIGLYDKINPDLNFSSHTIKEVNDCMLEKDETGKTVRKPIDRIDFDKLSIGLVSAIDDGKKLMKDSYDRFTGTSEFKTLLIDEAKSFGNPKTFFKSLATSKEGLISKSGERFIASPDEYLESVIKSAVIKPKVLHLSPQLRAESDKALEMSIHAKHFLDNYK